MPVENSDGAGLNTSEWYPSNQAAIQNREQERAMKDLEKGSGTVSKETAELIRASVSPNTIRAYRTAIKQLELWLHGRALTDALLADYISELFHDAGRSPAGISQAVSAVSWRAKHAGVPSVVGAITQTTLAGIRREGRERGRGQVQGISWAEVDRVCAYCEIDKSVAGLRDACLIRLMSDCLLRVSEAVAVDIEDINIDKNTLLVRSSKTDQTGEGRTLFVGDVTLDLVRRYQESSNLTEGALFRRMVKGDRLSVHRLTDRSARQIIKDRARAVGLTGFISGHSLRVGAAESLAQGGATLVEMQTAGRWADPKMPAHYARSEMAAQGAVARLRYGKGK